MAPLPVTEISSRTAALQRALAEENIDLALVRQRADLFYYAGAMVDGFLAVAPQGSPLLLVRRPRGRDAPIPSPWPRVFYQDLQELPEILERSGLGPRGALGLELDVMPAGFYQRIRERLFPQQPILDVSPLIRRQRMVKSPYEIEQLRRAAAILDQVHGQVPELLQPGISELELSAALEYRLRLLGHQGFVRVRNWELELFYGHVLSGTAGLAASYNDSPSGGLGFSPAFPQGPSLKKLAVAEPISVDLVACINGYVVDMTRMYALGSLPGNSFTASGTWRGPGGYKIILWGRGRTGWASWPTGWGWNWTNSPFSAPASLIPWRRTWCWPSSPNSFCRRSAWWAWRTPG